MSSFIVSPQIINRIVTLCYTASSNGHISNSAIRYLLREHNIVVEEAEDRQRLVKDLIELNMRAVYERYGDTKLETMPGKISKKISDYYFCFEECSRVRTLVSLECFLYQCSEGNVPETPLFKFLEDLKQTLAVSIVHGLPEYQTVTANGWGD